MVSPLDRWITSIDNGLRTLSGAQVACDPYPVGTDACAPVLSETERRLSGALMRVNHVGEVCAQALYHAQSLGNSDLALRKQFESAARDEANHLAWTHRRLRELGSRPSVLNPLWYAGAFGLGWAASLAPDAVNLGFVVETEHQVEQHLDGHLAKLPAADFASRAIVQQMKQDEARHAAQAQQAGAERLPLPVRWGMRLAARIMTRTAHYL